MRKHKGEERRGDDHRERGDHNDDGHQDHGRGHGHHGRGRDNGRRNNDDDKHDGRGHGNGDHNGDGRPDNGKCDLPPPPPPPPPVEDPPPPPPPVEDPPPPPAEDPPPPPPPAEDPPPPPAEDPPPPPPPAEDPPPPPPPAFSISLAVENVAGVATSDVVVGTADNDQITGGAGSDTISGGAGHDVILGDGDGRVTVALDIAASLSHTGDPWAIQVVVSGLPQGASLSAGVDNGDGSWTLTGLDLAGLTITAPDVADFTLHVVANSAGGSELTAQADLTVSLAAAGNDDVIDGGAGNDLIDAGAGNDRILDGAGNDIVSGGDGNDTIVAGAGDDSYGGDEGFDTVDFSAAGQGGGVYISLADGIASDMGNGSGEEMLWSIEGVIGSAGGDLILGDAQANRIDGGAGSDVIAGGAGADTMTGGADNDLFVIEAGHVVDAQGNLLGVDTITDLQVGDTILLGSIVAGRALHDALSLQGSTLYADINGQQVALAVLEGPGVAGMTLDDMNNWGMLSY